jgi:hypothetical protein
VLQLPVRQVDSDRLGTLVGQPPRALRGTAPHLEHPTAGDLAEQMHIRLVQALRGPHEPGVAEELPVLGLVLVGGPVPVDAVGALGRLGIDVRSSQAVHGREA